MWSIGISVSPCSDAEKIGYDNRQINRIVVRAAQFFLNRDMQVIFGHDWRKDGVMEAIAKFAIKVASGAKNSDDSYVYSRMHREKGEAQPRMINVVPTGGKPLSRMVRQAVHDSGGVLEAISSNDLPSKYKDLFSESDRSSELTAVRHWITNQLDPGCRVCLGGKIKGFEGDESGVIEEAKLALKLGKPLYLLGGFGGAARSFGESNQRGSSKYWLSENGLEKDEKRKLFDTTDVEFALRTISIGINKMKFDS